MKAQYFLLFYFYHLKFCDIKPLKAPFGNSNPLSSAKSCDSPRIASNSGFRTPFDDIAIIKHGW